MTQESAAAAGKRTVALVQARMASTRLPGKVLADIAGEPMLVRVVQRVRRARSVDEVVVATTDQPEDEAVVELCRRHGVECYRGQALDVLDRYVQAARAYQAELIVRVTGDCPLIDPSLIDRTVQAMLDAGARFAANRLPWDRSFPIGLDVEVCTIEALEAAGREADTPEQREHVMPWLYDGRSADEVVLVRHQADLSGLRWAVDEPADLDLVRKIYAAFDGRDDFTWQEVLELIEADPNLRQLNAHVRQRGLEASS